MPTIPITDRVGLTIDLTFDDKSDVARFGLKALESKTSEFVKAAGQPLDQAAFSRAVFGGTFETPSIAVNNALNLTIQSGANVTLSVFRSSDGSLFETGGASPEIKIAPNQVWVRVALETALSVQAGAALPSGLGVAATGLRAVSVAASTMFTSLNGAFPTLKEAVEKAFSNLKLVRDAAALRAQPENTVYEWDVAGTFSLEGSYGYPFASNAFSLAKIGLPLHHDIQVSPALALQLTGAIAVTGEFRGRSFKVSGASVQLGLYKKRETDLSAAFAAGAGIGVNAGSTDLVSTFFSQWPGADFKEAGVPAGDRAVMQEALSGAINQGFTIAFNSSCAAALTDETAVLYEVNPGAGAGPADTAVDNALNGNWTTLAKLGAAREIRNLVTHAQATGGKTTLNLLGIYDYASVKDFVRQCAILHNRENGAVTITDKQTAQQIAVSAKPFLAADDKLRKLLDEAFLATVAYAAADGTAGFEVRIEAAQSLISYSARASYPELRKSLLLGVALGLVAAGDLNQISARREFQYVRIAADAEFKGDNALRLFFSDLKLRTPYREEALKVLGRKVLASLLDRNSAADQARRRALTDDAIWQQMEAQKFPENSPASYSDWYDITFWAHSLVTVAPHLKSVLEAADARPPGDPTKNAAFMAERESLAKAIAEVTRNTRAAFEKGWPLAVMFALSGRKAPVSFTARWDGKLQFAKQAGRSMTAF